MGGNLKKCISGIGNHLKMNRSDIYHWVMFSKCKIMYSTVVAICRGSMKVMNLCSYVQIIKDLLWSAGGTCSSFIY